MGKSRKFRRKETASYNIEELISGDNPFRSYSVDEEEYGDDQSERYDDQWSEDGYSDIDAADDHYYSERDRFDSMDDQFDSMDDQFYDEDDYYEDTVDDTAGRFGTESDIGDAGAAKGDRFNTKRDIAASSKGRFDTADDHTGEHVFDFVEDPFIGTPYESEVRGTDELRRVYEETWGPVGDDDPEEYGEYEEYDEYEDAVGEATKNALTSPAKKLRKKHRKKRYLLKFAIIVALIVGMVFFIRSPFFNIDKIEVKNNNYYTQEQIIEMIPARIGDNTFLDIRSGEIKSALEKEPYIESVQVKRKLPDKLELTLVERAEYAFFKLDNREKKYFIISSGGLVLNNVKEKPDLVRLTGLDVTKAEVGESLKVKDNDTLTQDLKMIKIAEENGVPLVRIDTSGALVKCYVYSKLFVKGTFEDINECMESGKIQQIIYDLDEKGIKKGQIKVGTDNYCVYSPDTD